MSTTTQPLKYRFHVIYNDDTEFIQPDDDKSIKHIEDAEWNPSSFSDIDQNKLVVFCLVKDTKPIVGVNLENGLFLINGETVQLHDQNDILGKLKLIYFREVQRDNIDGEWQEGHITKYFVGWETVTGKKIKRTVGMG